MNNNYNKTYFFSLPLQWLFIIFIVSCIVGCSRPAAMQEVVGKAFTNQYSTVKATTVECQYIVRCEDGSIWEVRTGEGLCGPIINYKNCLFDPLYREIPPSPISLEKENIKNNWDNK